MGHLIVFSFAMPGRTVIKVSGRATQATVAELKKKCCDEFGIDELEVDMVDYFQLEVSSDDRINAMPSQKNAHRGNPPTH